MSNITISGGGGSSSLIVGTTAISNGANGLALFDNSGILGEIAHLISDGTNITTERLASTASLDWDSGAGAIDLSLFRDAADTLAHRRGTNPQTLHVYNTFTDASNYERAIFDWNETANTLTIGAEAAGTGTFRDIQFVANGAAVLSYSIVSGKWTVANNLTIGNILIAQNFINTGAQGLYLGAFAQLGAGISLNNSAAAQPMISGAFNSDTTIYPIRNDANFLGNVAIQAGGHVGLTVIAAAHDSVVCGDAAIATTAADGFLYIASCAGTPTGTPTTFTGRVPLVFDTTNNQLWIYTGGVWKQPKTVGTLVVVDWQ